MVKIRNKGYMLSRMNLDLWDSFLKQLFPQNSFSFFSLGWWIVSRQDPPKDCINPLRVFVNTQASQSVLKEMSNS